MECLQLLPGPETAPLCQFISFFSHIGLWGEANALWIMAALGALTLFFALRSHRTVALLAHQIARQTPDERAEGLLRDNISRQHYQQLLSLGYLEIPSRLYPNRCYRIPRERRRVQVYELPAAHSGAKPRRLGELCVIACEPLPDADLVLTHKWLIEADEEKYLNTANWIS